jgi:hypothetical protein
MSEVLDIIDSLGDEVSPMQSSQALSTLFHIQKFAAYVVDYLDETDYLECRAEFNRTLREQERYIRLVEMVSSLSLQLTGTNIQKSKHSNFKHIAFLA